MEKIRYRTLLEKGITELRDHGVEDAQREAELLLCSCLNWNRTQLFLHMGDEVASEVSAMFQKMIVRRASREPYAYIVGEREFFSLPFYVNKDVLIPRPETEFLLEKVLAYVKASEKTIDRCIDLCCGSGAIAVVLAIYLRTVVYALDISEAALVVTRKNSTRHNVDHLVRALHSDLLSGLSDGAKVPLIVTNPPYVTHSSVQHELAPEVALYEPHLALDGGDDGLDCIREIAMQALSHLQLRGVLFMEFGWDQGAQVKELFEATQSAGMRYQNVEIYKDYSGKDRVLFAEAVKMSEEYGKTGH